MTKRCITGTLFATLTCALGAGAQPLAYSLLPSAAGPSARLDGTIVYDPVGKQLLLFGGQDSQSIRNDLWRFSLVSNEWTALTPSSLPPQSRFGHTAIFDSARRRLIVFGGQAGGFFSDVWAYDIVANAWQQLASDAAGPSRRYGHSAIYESARDRMVISHGFTDAGRFDDTWAFDFKTNAWANLSPPKGRPLKRCLHHAAYDAANGQMYLYGGCSSGFGPCPQDDLWAFNLSQNTWQELTPATRPAGRDHYGMAYDTGRARLVLFAGSGNSLFNDTWEFDPASRAWQKPPIEGPLPTARSRVESTAAADLGAIFFFGGTTGGAFSNELWALTPVKPVMRPVITAVVNAFSLRAGAIAPGELLLIQGANLAGGDVSISINGNPAPLLTGTEVELRLQAPYELDGAEQASLTVTAAGSTSEAIVLPVTPTRPGVAMWIFNEDGTGNTADTPAPPDSTVTVLVTGYGATIPSIATGALPPDGVTPQPRAAASAVLGDRELEILSFGLSTDLLGVMRLVVRIPSDYPTDFAAKLIVTIGADSAPPVTIAIAPRV